MLTNRELILASRKYAKEDVRKSWNYTISTTLFLALSFVASFYAPHWSLKLLFGVVAGLFMVRFFVIYHDYQHEAILKKSKLGKFVMTLFGIFILAPTNIWKRTHDHHHNNNSKLSNSGIGSYPLLSKKDFNKLTKKERVKYLAARHPLTIFFGYITLFILDFNVKSIVISPRKHWDSFIALIFHIAMAVTVYYYGGILALACTWILPFVVANGLGAYLFYAQHNFPDATFRYNKEWEYTNAAINSTSFLVMNPVMNWFTGNIGYHHVHHVNHHIPFYRLKEAMSEIKELQNPKTTTLKPKDIIACLRLKVWDCEKGKMTAL
ncbi:fatty acid desaturase [Fulvivirga lutimaris]|nr:fatty acid desaturase [Fulvivirga lutimaris]